MRVAIVTYDRSAQGGAPDRVNGLIGAFQSRSDDLVVIDLPVRKPVYAPRHLPLWYLRPSASWRRNVAATISKMDLVIASRLGAANALLASKPCRSDAIFVYDAHNDETRLAGQIESTRTTRLIRRMEDRAIAGVDIVWVAGSLDAKSLGERHPHTPIINLPNGVGPLPDLSHYPLTPSRLFTYGSWAYPPNAAGLQTLAATPCNAHAVLSVFGDVPRALQAQLAASANACQPHMTWQFMGYEPDWHRMAGSGSVAIIPLWAGGGTKVRAAQLAAMGVPMVVTKEAVSGLPAWFELNTVVATSPGELLERAVAYVESSPLARRRLQERVRSDLSWNYLLGRALAESALDVKS